jgi:SAM-dependent methyltransferase
MSAKSGKEELQANMRSLKCPLCGEDRREYLFVRFGLSYLRCPDCGLIRAEEMAVAPESFGAEPRLTSSDSDDSRLEISQTETEAARNYLRLLQARGLKENSRVLLLSDRGDHFTTQGENLGSTIVNVHDHNLSGHLAPGRKFDAAVLVYQLQRSSKPGELLEQIHSWLKPGGLLLVVAPSLDSQAARMFGSAWTEWCPENRVYFSNTTIQQMLWKSGFDQLEFQVDERTPTMEHINRRAAGLPQTWLTRSVRSAYRVFPGALRNVRLSIPASGIIVIGRKASSSHQAKCTFIVPAYNEADTFSVLMSFLLKKQMPAGVKKEIIIIESNSNDGTRESVQSFEKKPEIRVIYQDQPRGKGNAVREGFAYATGDIVVIQDADLEYDLNDLDELLPLLLKYQAAFVLGSRHGGQWKMRQFANERGMSAFFNFGHQLFTGLLNLLYGQRLKDPFTMYKVFRRDCLHGLRFEANRFDFDFELVIKLIRKGYKPVEIPINYRSRSFKEGKKVRIIRDPLTWIWALVKYRFAPIYEEKSNVNSL